MVYPSLRGKNVDMFAGVQGHGLHPPGCSSQLASYLEVRVRWPSDHEVPLKDVVLHTSKSIKAMTTRSCHENGRASHLQSLGDKIWAGVPLYLTNFLLSQNAWFIGVTCANWRVRCASYLQDPLHGWVAQIESWLRCRGLHGEPAVSRTDRVWRRPS